MGTGTGRVSSSSSKSDDGPRAELLRGPPPLVLVDLKRCLEGPSAVPRTLWAKRLGIGEPYLDDGVLIPPIDARPLTGGPGGLRTGDSGRANDGRGFLPSGLPCRALTEDGGSLGTLGVDGV